MSLAEGAWGQPSTPLRCVSSSEREEESSRDRCFLWQRCLQALAAVSTHTSIVRETVPVLLQHLRKVQKGNAAHSRQLHGVCLGRSCLRYWLCLGESGDGSGAGSPELGCESHHWKGCREGGIVPESRCRSGGGCCRCLM